MKYATYIAGVLSIITTILGGVMIARRLSKANPQTYYEIAEDKNDSVLKIAIIGDSWASQASQYKLDEYMDSLLYVHNIKSKTYIKGEPGAKSKTIYLNMFSEDSIFSTKYIIQKQPQYCIIFGGINDLHGQYGDEYYMHHLLLIINTLLHYNIKPIIIEIPFFYNQEQYKLYSYTKQTGYKILSLLTSSHIYENSILLYRNTIVKSLSSNKLTDKVIYISTDSILKDNKNLYADNMHINQKGYDQLGEIIIQQIINNIKSNK